MFLAGADVTWCSNSLDKIMIPIIITINVMIYLENVLY